MSYYEYEARMYAYHLREIDKEEEMYLQAWLIQQAQATKEKGKYQVSVYDSFTDFFNKEERIKALDKEIGKVENKALTPATKKALSRLAEINK